MTGPAPERPSDRPLDIAPAEGSQAPEAEDPEALQRALEPTVQSLRQRGRSGAQWFYWVAGLSVINSVILLSGGDTFFVIGLGATMLADLVAGQLASQSPDMGRVVMAAAFGFDLVVALVLAGFGWLATQRHLVAFAVGMALYLADGLLFVWFQDWMCVGFHAFALYSMWSGFRAYRQLGTLEAALQSSWG
jgi:hypothetical protein